MLQSIRKFIRTSVIVVVFIAIVLAVLNAFLPNTKSSSTTKPVDWVEVSNKRSEALYEHIQKTGTPLQKMVYTSYSGFSCMLIGTECHKNEQGFNQSLLGWATNATVYAYSTPPASGVGETYRVLANAGFVPEIYAAEGIGFAAIKGFRQIWLVFRNLAFSVLVVIMVIMAFMIMFRMQLGAQTAIAIESALPRIVAALLLITFSYAIAGFLIDLMYVFLGLSITLLCNSGKYCNAAEQMNNYMTAGPSAIWSGFFPIRTDYNAAPGVLQRLLPSFLDNNVGNFFTTFARINRGLFNIMPEVIQAFVVLIGYGLSFMGIQYIITLFSQGQIFEITKNVQFLANSFGGAPAAFMGGWVLVALLTIVPFIGVPFVMFLFILTTIVGLFFRIYFMLLFTYLRILLYVMFAPIYMLMDAVPGQKGFTSWFRNLLGELITFPLIAIFFILGAIIVNNFAGPASPADFSNTQVWTPPFLSSGGAGSGYQVEQEAFLMIAGMGILFLIPDLVKMVKDSLGVKGTPLKFGLGTFLGGGAAGFALGGGLLGKGLQFSNLMFGSGGNKGLQGIITRQMDTLRQPFRKRAEDLPRTYREEKLATHFDELARNQDTIYRYERDPNNPLGDDIQKEALWERGKGMSPWRYSRLVREESKRLQQQHERRVAREEQKTKETQATRTEAKNTPPPSATQGPPPAQSSADNTGNTGGGTGPTGGGGAPSSNTP